MHIDRVIFLSNPFLGIFSHLEIIDKPYIIYAFFSYEFFFYSQIIYTPIYFHRKFFYNIENNV